MGYILLAGGAEFEGEMEAADRQAIALAGGPEASLSIIPAAAAPQNDHWNAGQNGVDWFESLGAVNVVALPLIDSASANSPKLVDILRRSELIYMLGGSPYYLSQILAGSNSWQAMLVAYSHSTIAPALHPPMTAPASYELKRRVDVEGRTSSSRLYSGSFSLSRDIHVQTGLA